MSWYLHHINCSIHTHKCVSLASTYIAPQFQWLTTTQEIQIYFEGDFTDPAPDGHEVLVWPKNGMLHSNATALSHYFPLSTLNATVAGLLPNTEYFLYVRANGTHFANNQGAWVGREVRTRPLGMLLHDCALVAIPAWPMFLYCTMHLMC